MHRRLTLGAASLCGCQVGDRPRRPRSGGRCLNARMRWGRTCVLAAVALGAAGLSAVRRAARARLQRVPAGELDQRGRRPAARRSGSRRPAAGLLSSDGGRSFRAPLSTSAFRRAQIAQATLLADGKTLLAMPTVWSAQQFTAPRWSSDGGASWQPGALKGADAHYDFGNAPGFVGESPVTADPNDARTAWFCQGNLYATHDAGRTWAVATPRFKRPWHCAALAIASGKQHTMILLVQSKAKNSKRVPGRLLRSVERRGDLEAAQGAALSAARLQRPCARVQPGAAVDGAHDRRERRQGSERSTAPPTRVSRGSACARRAALRGAVVDEFAFASDGRALALVRIGDSQRAIFESPDGGADVERRAHARSSARSRRRSTPRRWRRAARRSCSARTSAASGVWRPRPSRWAGP